MVEACFNRRDSVIDFNDYISSGLTFYTPLLETQNLYLNMKCVITNISPSFLHIGRNTEVNGYKINIEISVPYMEENEVKYKRIHSESNLFVATEKIKLGDFLDNHVFYKLNYLSLNHALMLGEIGVNKDNSTRW